MQTKCVVRYAMRRYRASQATVSVESLLLLSHRYLLNFNLSKLVYMLIKRTESCLGAAQRLVKSHHWP